MLLGQPTKLASQFRLTYSMILNLLRVEALRVEEMIKRSFSENASQRMLPEHTKKVTEVRLMYSRCLSADRILTDRAFAVTGRDGTQSIEETGTWKANGRIK